MERRLSARNILEKFQGDGIRPIPNLMWQIVSGSDGIQEKRKGYQINLAETDQQFTAAKVWIMVNCPRLS